MSPLPLVQQQTYLMYLQKINGAIVMLLSPADARYSPSTFQLVPSETRVLAWPLDPRNTASPEALKVIICWIQAAIALCCSAVLF